MQDSCQPEPQVETRHEEDLPTDDSCRPELPLDTGSHGFMTERKARFEEELPQDPKVEEQVFCLI